jgi:hypothetical protein
MGGDLWGAGTAPRSVVTAPAIREAYRLDAGDCHHRHRPPVRDKVELTLERPTMHKLLLLAAVALLSTAHQASADCGNGSCVIRQPSDEPIIQPEPKDCNNCAVPAPILPQRLAGDCSGCAVEQPDTVVLPPTPEDNCGNCALPTLQSPRAAFRAIVVVDSCSNC